MDDAIPTLKVLVAELDRVIATWAVGFKFLNVVLPMVDCSLVGLGSEAHKFEWAKYSPCEGKRSSDMLTRSKGQRHILVRKDGREIDDSTYCNTPPKGEDIARRGKPRPRMDCLRVQTLGRLNEKGIGRDAS